MALLLGLDIGTSNLKAVVYDASHGRIVAQAAVPTPTLHPQPGWTEFDPLAVWHNMAACIRRVLGELPSGQAIAAVAVASMGEAGVPLDAHGEPIYPIIAWFDSRAEQQAEKLRQRFGMEMIHYVTGQKLRPIFAAPKILWLKEHYPAVVKRLALWLSMEDYILWRLTRVAATDYSIASRTLLFDQHHATWWPDMLTVCGIKPQVLPQPLPSGTVVGMVTASAAHETGLTSGTPVATGGHDHLCGALAVGAVESGRILDSSGTAQSIVMAIDRFQGGGETFAHGFSCYRHVLRGRYTLQGGLNTAGSAVEWVVKLTTGSGNTYNELFAEAAQSEPGAGGLVCLPYFRGVNSPIVDASARAMFVGLTLAHRRGNLLRAVIEGLAYHLRHNLEHMAQVAPIAEGCIIAIGGANQHALVLQTKADVCNRPIVAPTIPEATAVGAALLAGLSIGVFSNEWEAAASVVSDFHRFEPDAQRTELYNRWYHDVYLRLYPVMQHMKDKN